MFKDTAKRNKNNLINKRKLFGKEYSETSEIKQERKKE